MSDAEQVATPVASNVVSTLSTYMAEPVHVPPPPANQMVYVTLKEGVQLDSMYAAFWVVGKMTARGKSTRLGAAAYGIAATRLEEYKY